MNDPEELKAIFRKGCLGGHKDIIELIVNLIGQTNDAESQNYSGWHEHLFSDNEASKFAIKIYETGNKGSTHYALGKYLQGLNHDGKYLRYINIEILDATNKCLILGVAASAQDQELENLNETKSCCSIVPSALGKYFQRLNQDGK